MAPYIEAIDSQHYSYFIVSRKKPTTYICFKMRLFSRTIEPTLFVLMVCIFLYSSVPLNHLHFLMFFSCFRYVASAISCVLDGSRCAVEQRSVHY